MLAVDGRRIGTGDAGPVTTQLSKAYAGVTSTSGTVVTGDSPHR